MSFTVLPEPRLDRILAGCPIARAAADAAAAGDRADAAAVERFAASTDASAAAAATIDLLPPPPDLADAVEYVWQLHVPAASASVWRVVVDGYLDLVVRVPLADEERDADDAQATSAARLAANHIVGEARAVVCGAAGAARVLPLAEPTLYTGVRFRMGAMRDVLRTPARALMDGTHPIGEVVGARTAALVAGAFEAGVRAADLSHLAHDAPESGGEAITRLLARAGAEEVARRLVARAAERDRKQPAADPEVRRALHLIDHAAPSPERRASDAAHAAAGGAPLVAAVARTVSLSPRALERRFADQVGFAPRTYQRLRRVGAVARAIEMRRALAPVIAAAPTDGRLARRLASADMTLSSLAHALSYTDHAHMTREFTRVMGVAPSRYLREALSAPVACRVAPLTLERRSPLGVVGSVDAARAHDVDRSSTRGSDVGRPRLDGAA